MSVTTPSSVLRAAEPVLCLLPQDRPLVIYARIATTSIGAVSQGQPASVRFPPLSSRITPMLTGEISWISADVLTAQATGAPYCSIEATLTAGELARLDRKALIPAISPVPSAKHEEGQGARMFDKPSGHRRRCLSGKGERSRHFDSLFGAKGTGVGG